MRGRGASGVRGQGLEAKDGRKALEGERERGREGERERGKEGERERGEERRGTAQVGTVVGKGWGCVSLQLYRVVQQWGEVPRLCHPSYQGSGSRV